MNSLLKKGLTIVLSITMLLSTLTFGTATVSAEGFQDFEITATEKYPAIPDTSKYFEINSEDEWNSLAKVKGDFAGKTIILKKSLTFTSEKANATIAKFAGTLDGNGNTIKGTTNPLIDTLNGGATIKNLIVEDANVNASASADVGGVASKVNVTGPITLDSIAIKNVTLTNTGTGTGGIIGAILTASNNPVFSITNCTVSGNITGKMHNGGVIGYVTSGLAFTLNMNNCQNNAKLGSTASSNVYYGGMSSYIGKTTVVNVSNCDNTGDFSYSGTLTTTQDVYMGAMFARIRTGPTLENCSNSGNFSINLKSGRAEYMGGLIGHVGDGAATIRNCVNYGNVTSDAASKGLEFFGGIVGYIATAGTKITNCANYGDITANNVATYITDMAYGGSAGGIVGFVTGGKQTITEAFNAGAIYSRDNYAGGIVGQTYQPVALSGCINVGNVYSCVNPETFESLTPGANAKDTPTGGNVIVPTAAGIFGGTLRDDGKNSTITNCINTGTIVSAVNAAGVLGSVPNTGATGITVTGCSNSGNVTAGVNAGGIIAQSFSVISVSECNATGTYKGTATGAIAGVATNVTIADCTASVKLNDTYTAWEGAAVSTKTEAQMLAELAVLNLEAQKSAVVEGKYDLLVLAALNDLTDLTKVGFKLVRIVDGKVTGDLSTEGTMVYTDVFGYDANGAQKVVNATDYANAEYLAAMKITNIPTGENVTYLYRAYAVKTVGEGEEPITLYSTWSAVTIAAAAQ